MHKFRENLEIGKAGEAEVRAWLELRGRECRTASEVEDKKYGIDLHVSSRDDGEESVQVKWDLRASSTGNAYIELVRSRITFRPGWAHKCSADWLAYVVVPDKIIWARPDVIRWHLADWRAKYRLAEVDDDIGGTLGLLVPLHALEAVSVKVTPW